MGYVVKDGGRLERGAVSLLADRRDALYHHMNGWNGWDWFWMVPMMLLWVAVLGGVVYIAVRLALQHSQKPPLPPAER